MRKTTYGHPVPFNYEAHKYAHDEDVTGNVRLIGPFTVDYTDFSPDTSVELFTPTEGDFFLNAFFDPATATDFDSGGFTCELYFGEDPASGSAFYLLPNGGTLGGSSDATLQAFSGNDGAGGYQFGFFYLPQFMFTGNTVVAYYSAASSALVQGHYDIYFLIATPESP